MEKYLTRLDAPQVPPYEPAAMAQGLTAQLAQFLFPLLVELDRVLDKRLVRTFLQTIAVILTFRDRANGLLLSELGGYLLSAEHAPAGTKRRELPVAFGQVDGLPHQPLFVAAGQRSVEPVATSRRARTGHLGREELGEARELAVGRSGPHAFQQSGSLNPHQAGLLLSAPRPDLCTRHAMAGGAAHRAARPARPAPARRPTLVD